MPFAPFFEGVAEHTRRRKILRVSAEAMVSLVRFPGLAGYVQDEFPEDGKIVGCYWIEPRIICLIVESASFNEVPEGEDLPDMLITYTITG